MDSKQATILEYATRFNTPRLVETGTWHGDTVEALRGHFTDVYSIELSEELHERAKLRFKDCPNVHLLLGDSGTILNATIDPTQRTLFWLDAHCSGGDTVRVSPSQDTRVLQELGMIFSLAPDSVILIDDAREFHRNYPVGHWQYNSYPTLGEVEAYVAQKMPTCSFEVKNDIVRIHAK
jgi:hypothetical protein